MCVVIFVKNWKLLISFFVKSILSIVLNSSFMRTDRESTSILWETMLWLNLSIRHFILLITFFLSCLLIRLKKNSTSSLSSYHLPLSSITVVCHRHNRHCRLSSSLSCLLRSHVCDIFSYHFWLYFIETLELQILALVWNLNSNPLR